MIAWIITLISSIYLLKVYKQLVNYKIQAANAWANLELLLLQQEREIKRLIEIFKNHFGGNNLLLNHANQLLGQLDLNKNSNCLDEYSHCFNDLDFALVGLLTLSEDFPDLHSDKTFNQVRARIFTINESLNIKIKHYNDAVNKYNHAQNFGLAIIISRILRFKDLSTFYSGHDYFDLTNEIPRHV